MWKCAQTLFHSALHNQMFALSGWLIGLSCHSCVLQTISASFFRARPPRSIPKSQRTELVVRQSRSYVQSFPTTFSCFPLQPYAEAKSRKKWQIICRLFSPNSRSKKCTQFLSWPITRRMHFSSAPTSFLVMTQGPSERTSFPLNLCFGIKDWPLFLCLAKQFFRAREAMIHSICMTFSPSLSIRFLSPPLVPVDLPYQHQSVSIYLTNCPFASHILVFAAETDENDRRIVSDWKTNSICISS